MTLYQLMCVDELIDETNAAWGRLKERHPLLDKYRDCRHFFELSVGASLVEREEIFSRLWDDCHGKFDEGSNALMILLCHQEFKEVFNWKAKFLLHRHDKVQLVQIMFEIFMSELARKKTAIIELQRNMNSELECMRKRLLNEETLFVSFEHVGDIVIIDATSPSTIVDSRDYHGVWNIIKRHIMDQKQIAWVKGLVATKAHIPGFDKPPKAPQLPSHETCVVRDKIAEVIKAKMPRLAGFVKERQKGKRRRSYES